MKQHYRIFYIQFSVALSLGALISRMPDLQTKFGLSEGQLGLLLAVMSAGVLCGLTFSVPSIERYGARLSAFVTVMGASTFFALVAFMPSALAAAPCFFAGGILTGAFEINANVETDRREALLGRRIMSRAHGMWSLGFGVTALLAAGLRQADVSIQLHMVMVLLVVVTTGAYMFSGIENAPARVETSDAAVPKITLPTIELLPLCLIGAAPLLAEGAGVDWSAIYMRDVFDAEPFVGGLAVALFSFTIAAGRLGMDPVVDRFSPWAVALSLLSAASIGLVIVAAAPHPIMALIGFCLMGLGCSSVYPLAISAAARRTDRPASINVAALGQTTFVVFFAGPPLLGFIAEHAGLRFSYWAVLPVLLAALAVSKVLAAPAERLKQNT